MRQDRSSGRIRSTSAVVSDQQLQSFLKVRNLWADCGNHRFTDGIVQRTDLREDFVAESKAKNKHESWRQAAA